MTPEDRRALIAASHVDRQLPPGLRLEVAPEGLLPGPELWVRCEVTGLRLPLCDLTLLRAWLDRGGVPAVLRRAERDGLGLRRLLKGPPFPPPEVAEPPRAVRRSALAAMGRLIGDCLLPR